MATQTNATARAGFDDFFAERLDELAESATPSRRNNGVRAGRDAGDDMVPDGRDTRLYPTFDAGQMERVARFAACREFAEGDALFEHGVKDAPIYFLEKGTVRFVVRRPGEEGGDREFLKIDAPALIGDISMFTGEPTIAACLADGPARALVVEPDRLRDLVRQHSDLGDKILTAFLARRAFLRDHSIGQMRLIGGRNDRETFKLRTFLERNQMPFEWSDPDRDESAATLLEALHVGREQTPVLIAGSSVCRRPSVADVARELNLKPDLGTEPYDLVVIGAGPAGLASAVYGASEGLRTLCLDGDSPGGQAGTSSKIENYLGFAVGISGWELARQAVLQARKFGAILSNPTRVVDLVCDGDEKHLTLDDGQRVTARSLVVGTGAEYRRLGGPGFDRYEGGGVYYAAGHPEAVQCRGEDVVIVGGGNSAGQAAIFMCRHANRVHLVIRGDDLGKSMSHYLTTRIDEADNIEVHHNTSVAGLDGDESLREAIFDGPGGGHRVPCSAIFVMIGAVPRTEWLAENDCVGMCPKGFVATGDYAERHARFADHWKPSRRPFFLETTKSGIFAVGDVRAGSVKRVASAVGEGAMAVKYVHEVLAA